MARKRRKSGIEVIFELLFTFIFVSGYVLFRIIVFLYDVITLYTTKYNKKSGNGFFKTYFDKGNYGEFILYRKLTRIFSQHAVLTNLYLDNVNTDKTEVDVIVVSNKNIYIFEMKNYAGYIYGSEKDKNWTQVFNKFSKHKFYNPLRQNYVHTKAVEKYLQVNNSILNPMVVFSNRSKLSKINVSQKSSVLQLRNTVKYLKQNEKTSENLISDDQKKTYIEILLEKSLADETVKQQHIEDVKSIVETG